IEASGGQPGLDVAEETSGDRAPGVVPCIDVPVDRAKFLVDVDPAVAGAVLADPGLEVLADRLGVKLDTPGAVADTERLQAEFAAAQRNRGPRRDRLVAMPLQCLQPRRQVTQQDVAAGVQLEVVPTDLRMPGPANDPARGTAQQL